VCVCVCECSAGRKGRKLQQDITQDLGEGLSVTFCAGSDDCILTVDVAPFHPDLHLQHIVLSQQNGVSIVTANGSTGPRERLARRPADAADAAAAMAPSGAATRGAATGSSARDGNTDLAAVIARAQALMARTAAAEQAEQAQLEAAAQGSIDDPCGSDAT
jgi:hypothetical protein